MSLLIIGENGWYDVREVAGGRWVWTWTGDDEIEYGGPFESKKSALKSLVGREDKKTELGRRVREEFVQSVVEENSGKKSGSGLVALLVLSVFLIAFGIVLGVGGMVEIGAVVRILGNIGMGSSIVWLILGGPWKN